MLMKFLFMGVLVMVMTKNVEAYEESVINIDGIEVSYVDVGQGPSLMLIHGLGADLTRYENNIAYLSKKYRVLALDLPGFGESGRFDGHYEGKFFVDTLESIRMKLLLGKISLVGNSMGGWLSLLYAHTYSENVESLVLLAPAFVFGLPEELTPEMLAKGAEPRSLLDMQNYLTRVLPNHTFDTKELEQWLSLHQRKNNGEAIQSIAKSLGNREFLFNEQSLKELSVKTLIIHGEDDGIVPVAASRHINTLMPNSTLVVFENSGHWPQWDNANKLNKLLNAYFHED
jgi:2-hydroxymuconate-semialdehyde hydrolase